VFLVEWKMFVRLMTNGCSQSHHESENVRGIASQLVKILVKLWRNSITAGCIR